MIATTSDSFFFEVAFSPIDLAHILQILLNIFQNMTNYINSPAITH